MYMNVHMVNKRVRRFLMHCQKSKNENVFWIFKIWSFLFSGNTLPLILEIVQLRRMVVGNVGNSKTKGPALGSVSASAAVMLTPLMLLYVLSQIWDSLGMSAGGLSLISIR